jgi:glycosyltransferase involved in cell wall biosynthesis
MKVSVIVCCYNEEKNLTVCLQSLKEQTYRDFELIVVDDGSVDGTSKIARDFGAKVIRIKHSGLPTARNVGVKNSYGDIVAFTDADCFVTPDWLEKLSSAIKAKNYDSVIGGTVKILNPQNFLVKCRKLLDRNFTIKTIAGGYNMAHKKEVIIKLNGFDPRFIRACDYDFNLRVLENGFKMGWVKDATVYFSFPETIRDLMKKQVNDGFWFRNILRKHPWHLKQKYKGIISGIMALIPFFRIRPLLKAYKQTKNLKFAIYHVLYGYAASLAFYSGFLWSFFR